MLNRVKIEISGHNPEFFLDKLIKRNIQLYDIKKDKKFIYVVVDYDDYLKIIDIKTTYKIKIISRYGVSKIKYLFNKYLIFCIAFIFGIFINLILSQMIFSVDIIHTDKDIRNMVQSDLNYYGIAKFHFKKSYDEKDRIIKKILKKEHNDIEWLEIEEIGTKYVVKVLQRKLNKKDKICNSRNIVAKKDAMILSIEADDGEVKKKKNDYVSKGDVIISGIIYNKEDMVSKRCAKGLVYGEVWYKVNLEVPKKYVEEKVTGNERWQLDFNFLGRRYSLFNKYKTYKVKRFNILNSRLLPLDISISKYLETNKKSFEFSLENISKKGLIFAEERLYNKISDEDVILSKKVLKKYEKNSKIFIEVFFKVKEEISSFVDISDVSIDEGNSEE